MATNNNISSSVCVCFLPIHSGHTSSSLDVPAGVTQEEGHTGFLIHLPADGWRPTADGWEPKLADG